MDEITTRRGLCRWLNQVCGESVDTGCMHINVRSIGLVLGVTMTLLAFTAQAREIRYAARMDQSQWQLQARPAQCVLSHEIPDYGQARFVQRLGQDVIFSMDITAEASLANTALIRSVPPAWNHHAQVTPLSQQPVPLDATTLALSADDTQSLLAALERGLNVEVVYRSVSDRVVVISAVRFLAAINDFHACAVQLSKTAMADKKARAAKQRDAQQASATARAPGVALTYTSVAYNGEEDTLSDAALSALTGIAREFILQKKNRNLQVVISGNCASEPLYKQRSALISIYLVSKGLPAVAVTVLNRGQLPETETAAASANSLQIHLMQ